MKNTTSYKDSKKLIAWIGDVSSTRKITAIRRNPKISKPLVIIICLLRNLYYALRQSTLPVNAALLPQTIQRTFYGH